MTTFTPRKQRVCPVCEGGPPTHALLLQARLPGGDTQSRQRRFCESCAARIYRLLEATLDQA